MIIILLILLGVFFPAKNVDSSSRVALVIGNGAYSSSPLENPPNDARDVAAALSKLGFDVIELTDAHKGAFLNALDEFSDKLRRAEAGLFYFAGHGTQIRGQNYLLPVGVHVRRESDVEYEGVNANRVLAAMEEAGSSVNIMILDACRDNPFSRTFRSGSRGLAMMRGAKGTFIAYATSPGSVAADGSGRNGVFTDHLLRHIDRPGLAIEGVFKRVRSGVVRATGGEQVPWDSSSLLGDFYFASADINGSGGTVQAQDAEQPTKGSHSMKTASLPTQFENRPKPKPADEGVVARDGHYVAYSNRVVRDTKTGLEWKAGPDKNTTWDEARDWVIGLIEGGESGWRMPTREELMTLYEKDSGKRNKTPLLENGGWYVWSAETKGSYAWVVNFFYGHRYWNLRKPSFNGRALAVRSFPASKEDRDKAPVIAPSSQGISEAERYTELRDGVVLDRKTGLEWKAGPDRVMTWNEARNWVNSIEAAGEDWRMPTRDELLTLYQKGKGERNITPLFETTGLSIWSGDTKGASHAWHISLISGLISWYSRDYSFNDGRAFAVRNSRNE